MNRKRARQVVGVSSAREAPVGGEAARAAAGAAPAVHLRSAGPAALAEGLVDPTSWGLVNPLARSAHRKTTVLSFSTRGSVREQRVSAQQRLRELSSRPEALAARLSGGGSGGGGDSDVDSGDSDVDGGVCVGFGTGKGTSTSTSTRMGTGAGASTRSFALDLARLRLHQAAEQGALRGAALAAERGADHVVPDRDEDSESTLLCAEASASQMPLLRRHGAEPCDSARILEELGAGKGLAAPRFLRGTRDRLRHERVEWLRGEAEGWKSPHKVVSSREWDLRAEAGTRPNHSSLSARSVCHVERLRLLRHAERESMQAREEERARAERLRLHAVRRSAQALVGSLASPQQRPTRRRPAAARPQSACIAIASNQDEAAELARCDAAEDEPAC
jgi:hypothetical protein